jgi:hypothetical protein
MFNRSRRNLARWFTLLMGSIVTGGTVGNRQSLPMTHHPLSHGSTGWYTLWGKHDNCGVTECATGHDRPVELYIAC